MDNQNNIISELEKSILEEPLDLTIDLAEIGLDEITDSEILKNIPVIKTLITIYKTGMSIKERHFAKKVMLFASHIHNDSISSGELEKRRNAINNNEKWIKKEMEQIIVFLDRFDFEYKAKILAKVYIAFINNKISSDKYLNMLPIIDKWQQYDEVALKTIYNENQKGSLNERDYVCIIDRASRQRLEALGIISIQQEIEDISYLIEDEDDADEICPYCLHKSLKLNYEGIILAEVLFEGIVISDFGKNFFNLSSI